MVTVPKVIIHSLEASLLFGESPTPKYGLQVNPFPLNLVQVVEVFVQVSQTLLPHRSFVLKTLVIWRILEGL